MANFFSSIFQRQLNVNVYQNSVTKPYSFNDLSFQQLELLYSNLADVRIIEDFVADYIAKIPVQVLNTRDTEVRNTPLNQLVEQTNPAQSWSEFIKEAFVFYGLTGNMFIKRNSDTGYLYTLQTSNMFVNLALSKRLPEFKNYIYDYRLQLGGEQYPLSFKEVFHLKTASLAAEEGLWVLGSSPYHSGKQNIKTLEATYSSRVSTIKDRGAMGFITNDSELPDQEQTQLVQDAMETYGTREQQKKTLVTTQKLRYQQMALGVAELQLLENLSHDFNTLCKLRGLDPLIFSSEGSTYANQKEASKGAFNNVVVPLANKFYDKFNSYIAPFYGGLRIKPNYESMSEYGTIDMDLSAKILDEVDTKILTPEQALEMLYPDLSYEVEPIEPLNIEEDD